MKVIRSLSGFGDSIYLRVIVEWLLENRPDNYLILSNYPGVFQDMNVEIQKFDRNIEVDYDCSYLKRKKNTDTTQFQDMVSNANLPPIEFTSKLKNKKPTNQTIVIPLYNPFRELKDSNKILIPSETSFVKLVNSYSNIKYLEKKEYDFMELVDIFNTAKLVICQQGWGVALAEMLDTSLLVCYNPDAWTCPILFLRTITPQKILEKSYKNSNFIIMKNKEDFKMEKEQRENIFIMGGGVSVENLDLKKLTGQHVIVINRSFETYPNATEMFFGDNSFFEEFGEQIMAYKVPKITVAKLLKAKFGMEVWNKTENTKELETVAKNLIKSNSGVMTINYALAKGAKLIILMGMDLKEINGRKHHHKGYKHPSKPKTCEQMLEEFKGIRYQVWKKFGADLIHATPDSALTEVDYFSLKDIISALKNKDYFGGWWLPKGEEHFRMMLKNSRAIGGRLSYQYQKLKPALEYVKDFTGIAVDIGSNVGFWAWHLAHKFSFVHCFEPISIHNECIRMNTCKLNNIKIYQNALSDKKGELNFAIYQGDCGKTQVSNSGVKVKCRTLDNYNLKHISFLKVDCEGWELPILRGAEKTLIESKPVIVVEQKEQNENYGFPKKGAVDYLISLGFVVRKEIFGDYIMTWRN